MLVYQNSNSIISQGKLVELKQELCTKRLNSVDLRITRLMLRSRDKLFKAFKKTRLHIDKELYKKARYDAQKLIATKKADIL